MILLWVFQLTSFISNLHIAAGFIIFDKMLMQPVSLSNDDKRLSQKLHTDDDVGKYSLLSHQLFIISTSPASFCLSTNFWQQLQVRENWKGSTGWMLFEVGGECVCKSLHSRYLCACRHLEKHTHTYSRLHTFSPWHHNSPRSRQEYGSERRGFVEGRKEMGGEEKEGKKERKRLGQGKVQQ